jgi:tryptophanyl-tRNA synthetase
MSPGVANLFTVLKALGDPGTHAELRAQYDRGALRYVDLKQTVADAVWRTTVRVQEGKAAYPPSRVREILQEGASRLRPRARAKIAEVREKIGLAAL